MFEIRFYAGKKRTTIPLGRRYTEKTAEKMLEVVEILVRCKDNGITNLDQRTEVWIKTASPELREKLARAKLIEIPPSYTLKQVWDAFLKHKEAEQQAGKLKEETIQQYENAQKRFFETFAETAQLAELSQESLADWKMDMLSMYKEGTVASQLKHTKSVLNWAVGKKWIEKSPLAGIGRGSFVNRKNDRMVTMADYRRLLAACPNKDWRCIISLARIGGLRCPSEVLRLRWEDIHWSENKFYVRSPKTEHHEGKEGRWVPIFNELKPELEALFAESGHQEHVINRFRSAKQNLWTPFCKIAKQAGLPDIPRPFDSMRMTRSNEVYKRWGAFKETQWIGHSAQVRADHYLMMTEEDYLDASESGNTRQSRPEPVAPMEG